MWCSHPFFVGVVKNSFDLNPNLTNIISHFEAQIKIWNREIFGNIFHKKSKVFARLAGIQKFPISTASSTTILRKLFLKNLVISKKMYSKIKNHD